MIYIVQRPWWEYKYHLNQLRCRHTDLESHRQDIPMEVLYYTFDISIPQDIIEPWWYGKKEKNYDEVFNCGTNSEKT